MSGKILVKCAECGKEEYVTPSREKKYRCCSVSCLGKYNSKKYSQKIELICPICGKKYLSAQNIPPKYGMEKNNGKS